MSIYNHSILKTNPVKVEIEEIIRNVYRVKWHGSDFSLDNYNKYNRKMPFQTAYDWYSYEVIRRRSLHYWGEERPEYIVDTGANYEGKLNWKDPEHKDGFDVFKFTDVSFQEADGYKHHIGKVVKLGHGKYKFISKDILPTCRYSI